LKGCDHAQVDIDLFFDCLMENLAATAGGQRIGAADRFFDYLTIKMQDPNLGFSKIQFNVVPEPASMIFFGTGPIVFARYLRKKFKK